MFPWPSFISYVLIITYTPGPNNIMSMNNAKNVGFRKGFPFILGIFTGTFIIMNLCLLFSVFLYSAVPKIQFPMKLLGAAYMAYLILKTLIPSKNHEARHSSGKYIAGALLQLVNPKLMLYGMTTMSSFILPHYSNPPVLILFSFLLSVVGFSSLVCWSLFGSLFSMLFNKHGKVLNIIMALLLLYCIIALFL